MVKICWPVSESYVDMQCPQNYATSNAWSSFIILFIKRKTFPEASAVTRSAYLCQIQKIILDNASRATIRSTGWTAIFFKSIILLYLTFLYFLINIRDIGIAGNFNDIIYHDFYLPWVGKNQCFYHRDNKFLSVGKISSFRRNRRLYLYSCPDRPWPGRACANDPCVSASRTRPLLPDRLRLPRYPHRRSANFPAYKQANSILCFVPSDLNQWRYLCWKRRCVP